jgi:putative DNA-invertase from lambdoid prophage Rac|tara:strand:- start:84 stop:878 length:795 start_codon:yes stop_codon:yes gene_type:complete
MSAVRAIKQINRVFGYVRVSTREQVRSGISLETQEQAIRQFVSDKYGREVDEIFVDDGVSGTRPILDRPGSRELTDSMDEFDVIVCTRLDRLSRNAGDLLSLLPDLEDSGVTLYFCEQFGDVPVCYPKHEGSKGLNSRFDMNEMANKIMLMVLSAVSEIEHANIRDRFGDGKVDWASRGYFIGGSPPYGYKCVPVKIGNKTRKRLEPIPEEQAVIKAIKALSGRGLGYRRVAAQINSMFPDTNITYNKVEKILKRKFQGLCEAS